MDFFMIVKSFLKTFQNIYCSLPHLINYEMVVLYKSKQFEKCDMTFVSLEKTLDYYTIQESLRSEHLAEYYLFIYV